MSSIALIALIALARRRRRSSSLGWWSPVVRVGWAEGAGACLGPGTALTRGRGASDDLGVISDGVVDDVARLTRVSAIPSSLSRSRTTSFRRSGIPAIVVDIVVASASWGVGVLSSVFLVFLVLLLLGCWRTSSARLTNDNGSWSWARGQTRTTETLTEGSASLSVIRVSVIRSRDYVRWPSTTRPVWALWSVHESGL